MEVASFFYINIKLIFNYLTFHTYAYLVLAIFIPISPLTCTPSLPRKFFQASPFLLYLFCLLVELDYRNMSLGFFSAAWAILSTTTPLKTTAPLPRDPLTNHSLLVSNGISWALLPCMMKWRWSNLVPVTVVAEITRKNLVLSRRQHFTSVLPFLQLVHSVSLSCCSCVLERIIQRSYLECIVNSHLFLALWPVMGFCVNWCPGPKKKNFNDEGWQDAKSLLSYTRKEKIYADEVSVLVLPELHVLPWFLLQCLIFLMIFAAASSCCFGRTSQQGSTSKVRKVFQRKQSHC